MDDEPPYRVLTPIDEDATRRDVSGAGAHSGARACRASRCSAPRDDVDAVLSRYQHWKPALGRIQHPGVGRLLDVGLTSEGAAVCRRATTWPGWPLSTLGSRAAIGMAERADIARQPTGAFEAAHAADVVHLRPDASKVRIRRRTASTPRSSASDRSPCSSTARTGLLTSTA